MSRRRSFSRPRRRSGATREMLQLPEAQGALPAAVTDKRLIQGTILYAVPWFSNWNWEERFSEGRRNLRGARAAGLSYERKVERYLQERVGDRTLIRSFPFRFRDAYGWRMCVPDFLLFDFERRSLVVIEVKLKHSGAASLELELLYLPVVRAAFSDWTVRALEVCRWYYPGADATPVVRNIERWLTVQVRVRRGVHIWGGRR